MLNIPFAPGVGEDRFIPKSSKNVDKGRLFPPETVETVFSSLVVLFGDDAAALFESLSLTLFLAFFKRRSMAAMESSSSFMSSDSSPVDDDDDDDAASMMMRIVVLFFVVRFVVVAKLVLVVFLPADDPFEDEEKAEETRLCASRDREDRVGVLNIIITRRRRRRRSFTNEDKGYWKTKTHVSKRRRKTFL